MSSRPIVSNVKGRLNICTDSVDKLCESLSSKEYTQFSNFVTLEGTYNYVVFLSGTINVMGIKSFEEVNNVVPNVCADFDIEPSLINSAFVVDSSTATGSFARRLDLTRIQRYIHKKSCSFTTKFNREIFSSLYCYSKRGPTVVLFTSGKYNILAAKCPLQLDAVVDDLTVIVRNAMKKSTRETNSFFAT